VPTRHNRLSYRRWLLAVVIPATATATTNIRCSRRRRHHRKRTYAPHIPPLQLARNGKVALTPMPLPHWRSGIGPVDARAQRDKPRAGSNR